VTITAAADGSALGNPGPAGWAWYIDEDRWAAGGWKHGTNNMGELKAVLELFRATAGVDDDLLVLCDSQYVINSVTKWMPGWKRKGWRKADGKPVMNVDLLQELDAALDGRRYRFEWVRGHVGHELNEAADERARAVATAYQRGTPIPAGPGFGGVPAAPQPSSAPAAPAARGSAAASLFDLDEPERPHRLTLELTTEEWDTLQRQARNAGTAPEEVVRTLLRGARTGRLVR
jgi:ribonuclease HI